MNTRDLKPTQRTLSGLRHSVRWLTFRWLTTAIALCVFPTQACSRTVQLGPIDGAADANVDRADASFSDAQGTPDAGRLWYQRDEAYVSDDVRLPVPSDVTLNSSAYRPSYTVVGGDLLVAVGPRLWQISDLGALSASAPLALQADHWNAELVAGDAGDAALYVSPQAQLGRSFLTVIEQQRAEPLTAPLFNNVQPDRAIRSTIVNATGTQDFAAYFHISGNPNFANTAVNTLFELNGPGLVRFLEPRPIHETATSLFSVRRQPHRAVVARDGSDNYLLALESSNLSVLPRYAYMGPDQSSVSPSPWQPWLETRLPEAPTNDATLEVAALVPGEPSENTVTLAVLYRTGVVGAAGAILAHRWITTIAATLEADGWHGVASAWQRIPMDDQCTSVSEPLATGNSFVVLCAGQRSRLLAVDGNRIFETAFPTGFVDGRPFLWRNNVGVVGRGTDGLLRITKLADAALTATLLRGTALDSSSFREITIDIRSVVQRVHATTAHNAAAFVTWSDVGHDGGRLLVTQVMPTPGFSFQTRTVLGHAHAAEVQSTPWGPVLLAKTSLDSLEISRLDDATLAAGPSYTFSDHFEWPLSWHVTADGFLLSYQGQGPTTGASVTRASLFDSNLHETWSGRILPNDNLSRPLACRGGTCLLENNQAPRHAYIATFGASGVTTRPWTEADRTVFDRCPDFMSVRDGAVLMPNNRATLMAQSGACATASFVTFPDLRTPYLCAEVPGHTDVCDPVITRFATTRTHVVAAEVHSDAVSAASLLLRVFRSDSLQQEVTRLTTTLPNGARIKGFVHFENGLFGVIYGITNPYTDSLEAWLRPVYLPQAITLTP